MSRWREKITAHSRGISHRGWNAQREGIYRGRESSTEGTSEGRGEKSQEGGRDPKREGDLLRGRQGAVEREC